MTDPELRFKLLTLAEEMKSYASAEGVRAEVVLRAFWRRLAKLKRELKADEKALTSRFEPDDPREPSEQRDAARPKPEA